MKKKNVMGMQKDRQWKMVRRKGNTARSKENMRGGGVRRGRRERTKTG